MASELHKIAGGTAARRRASRWACVVALAALSGCRQPFGLLYHDVRLPLTTDFDRTPAGVRSSDSDVKGIKDPFFTGIEVLWDSNAIGDIAKTNGIEDLYYADSHNFRIFFGLWSQSYVVLHGK